MERSVMKTPGGAGRLTLVEAEGARHWREWWPLVFTFALFLLARPYEGFVHDARLYVGFAIAPLDPNGIGADLLFREDAQSGRSLYPVLLRSVAVLTSPSHAALFLTLAGLGMWFAGAWRLCRVLWPELPSPAIAGLLLIATGIQTTYGGSSTFHIAEAFASPRNMAEGLVLLSLSFSVAGRLWHGAALLLAALTMHPLMAAPGAALAIWMAMPTARLRWWAVAFTAVSGMIVVVATAVGRSHGILATFDAEWLGVLDAFGTLVFLRNWSPLDWARIIVHATTLFMALELVGARTRTVLLGLAIVTFAALLLSFTGGDVVHNMLITQAQPWRALWLLAAFGGFLLARLLQSVLWSGQVASDSRAACRHVAVALLLVSWFMMATSSASATLALLAVLLWKIPDWRPSMYLPVIVARVIGVLTPLALCLLVYVEARVVLGVYAAAPDRAIFWRLSTFALAGVLRPLAVAIAWGLWWSRGAGWRHLSAVGAAAACAAMAALVLVFDSRSAFERSLEGALDRRIAEVRLGAITSQPSLVLPGPVVWADGEVESWAFFGAGGYGNLIQGMPRVFSRRLAITWANRRERLIGLQSVVRAPRYRLRLDRLYSDDPSGIRELCALPDAPATVVLPRKPVWAANALDVVLPSPQMLPGQDLGVQWEVWGTFFLVRCSDLAEAR